MPEQFHFDPETYLDEVRAEVPGYGTLQGVVAEAAGEISAHAILDLGTGTGETLRHVAAKHPAATLVGIDESEEMLAVARTVVPHADLQVAQLQDVMPDGEYDLVVSALAVHHLDRNEKADLFGRVAASLHPGGRFVLGDLIVPDDPADVVTPIDRDYDKPSRIDEQLEWLADADLVAEVRWCERDLAVIVADKPRGA